MRNYSQYIRYIVQTLTFVFNVQGSDKNIVKFTKILTKVFEIAIKIPRD
jgi:hypothetical protein